MAVNAAFLTLTVVLRRYSLNMLKHIATYLITSYPLTPLAVEKLSMT